MSTACALNGDTQFSEAGNANASETRGPRRRRTIRQAISLFGDFQFEANEGEMKALEDARRAGMNCTPGITIAARRIDNWSERVAKCVETHNSKAKPTDGSCDTVQVRVHENTQGKCTEVLGSMLGDRFQGEHRRATEVAKIIAQEDIAAYCVDLSNIQQTSDAARWACRKRMHDGTTRVLVCARGTRTLAHCIGLHADRKMKMEEWDALLGYRQPTPKHGLIDNHDRNCMRSWPAQMPGDNASITPIVAAEPAAGEASGASVEEAGNATCSREGESGGRSCLCCGMDHRPTKCVGTTANPGACFTVYCNTCWEHDRESCEDRSEKIMEWQQYNRQEDPTAILIFGPQLTLFSRDDDQALFVSGCGTESEEEGTYDAKPRSTDSTRTRGCYGRG